MNQSPELDSELSLMCLTAVGIITDAMNSGWTWEATLNETVFLISKQAHSGRLSEELAHKLVDDTMAWLQTWMDEKITEEIESLKTLVELYKAAPKLTVEKRTHLVVDYSEAATEDPSGVLGQLIDGLGLDYLGLQYEGRATFDGAAPELVEDARKVIGVVKVEVKKSEFVSIDGGPWRPRQASDPVHNLWVPTTRYLDYEDYLAVFRNCGIEDHARKPTSPAWRHANLTHKDQFGLITRGLESIMEKDGLLARMIAEHDDQRMQEWEIDQYNDSEWFEEDEQEEYRFALYPDAG